MDEATCLEMDALMWLVTGETTCKGTPTNGGCHCNGCLLTRADDRCYSCFPDAAACDAELRRRQVKVRQH